VSRTLVTGATGFVGSHVAEAYREAGHEVRCTVRASSDLRWIRDLDVQRVEADLRDPGRLREALEGVDRVVHVAGVTAASRPSLYREVNVEGTRRLAEAAAAAGVGRFVFVSSLAARGPDGARGPVSAYGRSKREAEEALARAGRGPAGDPRELETVVLRPAGVYGPRDTDLLTLFRAADAGWLPTPTGASPLQPVYARDVAEAALLAGEGEAPGFGPWPLAEERRYRWKEVAAGMAEALDRPVRTVPVPGWLLVAAGAVVERVSGALGRTPELDRRRAKDLATHAWTCDPRVSEEALGWRPAVPLAAGLRRTARWYREAGWL
jgi:nucleoside-diphosphate-sugar epimerase